MAGEVLRWPSSSPGTTASSAAAGGDGRPAEGPRGGGVTRALLGTVVPLVSAALLLRLRLLLLLFLISL
jgi:hypothetical protein